MKIYDCLKLILLLCSQFAEEDVTKTKRKDQSIFFYLFRKSYTFSEQEINKKKKNTWKETKLLLNDKV